MINGELLEVLRDIFQDTRLHIALAQVEQIEVAQDRSECRVKCLVIPERREVIARMSWEVVGPDSGDFQLPQAGDLVLVVFSGGDEDLAFVIKRLTSREDKIPARALDSDRVIQTLAGKILHLLSDTTINLGRGGAQDPDESLVLGNTFRDAYSDDLEATAEHRHVCLPPGYLSVVPDNATDFTTIKSSPVDDGVMLSDLSFTEK